MINLQTCCYKGADQAAVLAEGGSIKIEIADPAYHGCSYVYRSSQCGCGGSWRQCSGPGHWRFICHNDRHIDGNTACGWRGCDHPGQVSAVCACHDDTSA